MTNGHITYRLHFSLINEMQEMAATMRLANEVPRGHRGGARTLLVRWLRAQRERTRGAQTRPAATLGDAGTSGSRFDPPEEPDICGGRYAEVSSRY